MTKKLEILGRDVHKVDECGSNGGPCKRVHSLVDYLSKLKCKGQDINTVYRGQMNSKWGITCGLGRVPSSFGERDIYKEVKRYDMKRFQDGRFINHVAQMQHYSIPTRLVDWTTNPLIALFFAVDKDWDDEKSGCEAGKVFCYRLADNELISFDEDRYKGVSEFLKYLHTSNKKIKAEKISCLDISRPYSFVETEYTNDRMEAQRGIFLVDMRIDEGRIEGLVQLVERSDKISEETKEKFLASVKDLTGNIKKEVELETVEFEVPEKCKLSIKKELDLLGINGFSVYPDMSGFAKYINARVKENKITSN